MMIPYILDQKCFESKKQLRLFVSGFLKSASLGAVDANERGWIMELLRMHPRFEEKSAQAVGMIIECSVGNNHFSFLKADGSTEDISYIKCLDHCRNSTEALAKSAFRAEVRYQIEDFRQKVFSETGTITCIETGHLLSNNSKTHIDHNFQKLTFKDLLDQFLQLEKLRIAEIETFSEGTHGRRLKDKNLAVRFREYHAANADLRPIHWSANIAKHQ